MYCTTTDTYLPLPLSGWHPVENCLLQVGTIDSLNQISGDECSIGTDKYDNMSGIQNDTTAR